jgi:hypothetical protein
VTIVLTWLVLGAAVVLVAGGVGKLLQPDAVRPLVAAVVGDARTVPWFGRASGVVEVAVAIGLLTAPHPVVLVAAATLFGLFAALVQVARRRGVASCGCFGVIETPPNGLHVALNVVVAAALLAAAVNWSTVGGTLLAWDADPARWIGGLLAGALLTVLAVVARPRR